MKRLIIVSASLMLLVALWIILRSPYEYQLVDNSLVQEVITLEDSVLYFTNDDRLRRYDIDKDEAHTLATIDAGDVKFHPSGKYASYTQDEFIHVMEIESTDTVAKLKGSTHTWQSDTKITYMENGNDSGSTFFNVGALKVYDIEKETKTAIGETEVTKIHATSDTKGIIHQAFGEGGETQGRLLRYDITSGSIEALTPTIDILNTTTATGVFAFESSEGFNLITSNGDIKEVSLPKTRSQYHALSKDLFLSERFINDSKTMYTYSLKDEETKELFEVSEVGEPLRASVSSDYIVVATQQGLYLGGY